MKTLAIIPARYASSRFPGKPLAVIRGKTMIQRVYEQALKSKTLDRIIVATDDARIADTVKSFGGEVMMTSESHTNGTERCIEVLFQINTENLTSNLVNKSGQTNRFAPVYDIVVNIQGDEPFIDPEDIDKVVALLKNNAFDIATLAKKIDVLADLDNPNVVKIIFDAAGKALYFSRHAVPYLRDVPMSERLKAHDFYKHVGLYAFRGSTLLKLPQLRESLLEKAEKLEQLRWLENGFTIGVTQTQNNSVSIDTPEDLAKII